MAQETREATAGRAGVDREAIRADLERTKAEFHVLLQSLTPEELRRKSGNAAWTVGQLMWHVASSAAYSVDGVDRSKKEKGFNPPGFVSDRINVLITRFGSRKATKASVAQKYNEAHTKLIAALDRVRDDEWQKGARFFGKFLSVEDQFRAVPEHFTEHKRDIDAVR